MLYQISGGKNESETSGLLEVELSRVSGQNDSQRDQLKFLQTSASNRVIIIELGG